MRATAGTDEIIYGSNCSGTIGIDCCRCISHVCESICHVKNLFSIEEEPKPKQPDKWKRKYKRSVPLWQR